MKLLDIDRRILIEEFKNALSHSAYLRAMVDASSARLEIRASNDRPHTVIGTLTFELAPAVRGL